MRLNILIADDQEIMRQGIRALVEGQAEWRICGEASTGGETIEKARNSNPDMLLLDVAMRDMKATEVIREVRAICPAVKIVALAMPASGELAAKALSAGASGLAMKSDAAKDFLETLLNIGKSRPFLSPAASALLQVQVAKEKTSQALPGDLTPRELDVLILLAKGRANKAVAALLDISVKTVDVHRGHIMRKLRLDTYSDLIQFAIRHKLIEI
jgi:DNA-binding NarL/FixJ family response regulator